MARAGARLACSHSPFISRPCPRSPAPPLSTTLPASAHAVDEESRRISRVVARLLGSVSSHGRDCHPLCGGRGAACRASTRVQARASRGHALNLTCSRAARACTRANPMATSVSSADSLCASPPPVPQGGAGLPLGSRSSSESETRSITIPAPQPLQ